LTIDCADPAVPTDDRNLIVRAANLLRPFASASSGPLANYHVELSKTVPMGGGLGGGSSNGAAALFALNGLWNAGLSRQQLAELAAQLGSDVPFFLHQPSAICSGRGEIVRSIAAPACRWAVLILPGMAMPTAAVYRRFDALPAEGSASNTAAAQSIAPAIGSVDLAEWCSLSAEELLPRLVNDLEPPAYDLRPDLAALRTAAEAIAARPVRMSGSGSTLFTLFDTKDGAERAAQEISRRLNTKALAVRIAP
jgi:4-diphosphocytidyl-2-C-methyl-D-erythritol kinase